MAANRQRISHKRDRLRQLRAFSHVAQLGSVKRAAEHLGLRPSAVSLQVRELEDELEAYLLDRDASGVSLTPAGERFYKRVEPLVEQMDMLFANYSSLIDDSVSGWLELATSVAGAANVFPPYAKRLRDLYPRARLRVRKCAPSEGLTMLLADEVELVVGALNSAPDKLLEYREVLSYNIVLITSLDHPLAGRETITLQEAARWPAIVPPAGTYSRQLGEAVARQVDIDIFAVIEVGGWGVLKRYVENGLGVSAVPSICIHKTDQVSVIPIEEYFPSRSFGIFSRRGRHLTAPAWQLLKLMVPNL